MARIDEIQSGYTPASPNHNSGMTPMVAAEFIAGVRGYGVRSCEAGGAVLVGMSGGVLEPCGDLDSATTIADSTTTGAAVELNELAGTR